MKKNYFHIILLTFLIVAFLPLHGNLEEHEEHIGTEDTAKTSTDTLLENFALLSEIVAFIEQEHLDNPDSKELMEGAIRGMLRTLDPYSQYIPDYLAFRMQNRGNYGGSV